MRRLLCSFAAALAAGCSIDFVALSDVDVATSISVRSIHDDSLRATIDVRHTGIVAPAVDIGGDVMAADRQSPSRGVHEFRFEVAIDPGDPVVAIRVDQSEHGFVEVRVPVLARTGDARCASGAMWLPTSSAQDTASDMTRRWDLRLLDAGGNPRSTLSSLGRLPDSLPVAAALVDDSVSVAEVTTTTSGAVRFAPTAVAVAARSTVEWAIPGDCR